MKKLTISLAVVATLALTAQEKVIVNLSNFISEAVDSSLFTEFTFPDESTLQVCAGETSRNYALAEVDSVTFAEGGDVVTIEYLGDHAKVYNPKAFEGVSITVDGADVTVNSTTSEEIEYRLSGATTDGSFKIYGVVKYVLTLDGVSITNSDGAAINSQCKKKMTLNLPEGTVSTLTDGSSYNTPDGEDEKGCLFSEGQIEVNGTGTLQVAGLKKHGICTDDDFQLKSGNIVILQSASDGVHSKDAFKMSGGTLTISGNASDGIDGDEGIVKISGGEIDVTASAADTKAIACDSTLTISGGTVKVTLSGDQSKGLKSKQSIYIKGGDLTFKCTGNAVDEGGDMSYCTAIKSDSCIYVSDGVIDITHSGTGGKGLSADIDLITTGGTIKAVMSGDGGTYTTTENVTDTYSSHALSSDGNMYLLAGIITLSASGKAGKCIKSDAALTIGDENGGPTIIATTSGEKIGSSSSGGRPGPGGGSSTSGDTTSSPKAITCEGAFVMEDGDLTINTSTDGAEGIESKTSMDFNGGSVYVKTYDDCINSAGIIRLAGSRIYAWSTGNDAIDSNALTTGAITVSGGIVVAFSTAGGAECALDADNAALVVSGGYLFTASGSSSNGGFGGFGGGGAGNITVPNSSTATQPTVLASGISLSPSKYISVCDSQGTLLFSFLAPVTISSSTSLISCPGFASGKSYSIGSFTTAPTGCDSEWNGFGIGGSASSITTSKTFTFSSNYISI